jgi:hypothetical protein
MADTILLTVRLEGGEQVVIDLKEMMAGMAEGMKEELAKVQEEMGKGGNAARRFGAGVQQGTQQAKTGFASMQQPMEQSIQKISAMTMAFATLSGGGIAKFIGDAVAFGSAMKNMAIKTGMTTQELGTLKLMADKTDTSIQYVTFAMQFLGRSMTEAATKGTSDAADAFKKLGIGLYDATGKMKEGKTAFYELIQNFDKLGTTAEKNSVAFALFGARMGRELIPLLSEGKAGFDDAAKMAEKLGISLNKFQVRALDELDGTVKEVKASFQGFWAQIATTAQPVLMQLMTSVRDAIVGFKEWVKEHPGIVNAVMKIIEALGKIASIVVPIALVTKAFNELKTTISSISLVEKLTEGFKEKFVDKFIGGFTSMTGLFKKHMEVAASATAGVGSALENTLAPGTALRVNAAGLAAGFSAILPALGAAAVVGGLVLIGKTIIDNIAATNKWKESLSTMSKESYSNLKAFADQLEINKNSIVNGQKTSRVFSNMQIAASTNRAGGATGMDAVAFAAQKFAGGDAEKFLADLKKGIYDHVGWAKLAWKGMSQAEINEMKAAAFEAERGQKVIREEINRTAEKTKEWENALMAMKKKELLSWAETHGGIDKVKNDYEKLKGAGENLPDSLKPFAAIVKSLGPIFDALFHTIDKLDPEVKKMVEKAGWTSEKTFSDTAKNLKTAFTTLTDGLTIDYKKMGSAEAIKRLGPQLTEFVEANRTAVMASTDDTIKEIVRMYDAYTQDIKPRMETAKKFIDGLQTQRSVAAKAAGIGDALQEANRIGITTTQFVAQNREALIAEGNAYETVGAKNIPTYIQAQIDAARASDLIIKKTASVTDAVKALQAALIENEIKAKHYAEQLDRDLATQTTTIGGQIDATKSGISAFNLGEKKAIGKFIFSGSKDDAAMRAQEETLARYNAEEQKLFEVIDAIDKAAAEKKRAIKEYYDAEKEGFAEMVVQKKREIELIAKTAATEAEVRANASDPAKQKAAMEKGFKEMDDLYKKGISDMDRSQASAFAKVDEWHKKTMDSTLPEITNKWTELWSTYHQAVGVAVTEALGLGDANVLAAQKSAAAWQLFAGVMNAALSGLSDIFKNQAADAYAEIEKVNTQAAKDIQANPENAMSINAAASAQRAKLMTTATRKEAAGSLVSALGGGLLAGFGAHVPTQTEWNNMTEKEKSAYGGGPLGSLGAGKSAGVYQALTPFAGMAGGALGQLISGKKSTYAGTGSSIGGAIGGLFGPLGGLIGSLGGGLLGGLFGKKEKKTEEQLAAEKETAQMNEAYKATAGLGKISEATAKKIADFRKTMSGAAAESMTLADMINDTGVTLKNQNELWTRGIGIIDQWNKGALTSKQATDSLGASFTALLAGTKELGTEGSKRMTDFIETVRASGLKVKEVTDYVNSQLGVTEKASMNAVQGLVAMNAAVLPTDDAFVKMTTDMTALVDKLKKAKEGTREFNQLTAQVEFLRDKIKAAAPDAEASLKRIERQTMATFNAMMLNGASYSTAMESIGPALDALAENYKKLGLEGGAGMKELLKIRQVTKDHKELFDAVEGNLAVLNALANTASLDATSFDDSQKSAMAYMDQLKSAGLTGDQALAQMGPTLKKLRDLAKDHGYVLDENTQKAIKAAEEQGIIGKEEMSTNETLMAGFGAILKALGADVPDAFKKAMDKMKEFGDKEKNGLGGMEGGFKDAAKTGKDEVDGLNRHIHDLEWNVNGVYSLTPNPDNPTPGEDSGDSGPDNPPGCFRADTKITMLGDDELPISEVKVGDWATGYDEEENLVAGPVFHTFRRIVKEQVVITTDEGETFTSPEHPFYIGNGEYILAGLLIAGDTLIFKKGCRLEPRIVLSVKKNFGEFEVFNIEVGNVHTYFANGFAVHNKKSAQGGYYGDVTEPTELFLAHRGEKVIIGKPTSRGTDLVGAEGGPDMSRIEALLQELISLLGDGMKVSVHAEPVLIPDQKSDKTAAFVFDQLKKGNVRIPASSVGGSA